MLMIGLFSYYRDLFIIIFIIIGGGVHFKGISPSAVFLIGGKYTF